MKKPLEGPACQVRLLASPRRGRGRFGLRPNRVREPAVSFLRKQESRNVFWIPTFVGMTYKGDAIGWDKHAPPFG